MNSTVSTSAAFPINPVFLNQAHSLCQGGELLPGGAEALARRLQRAVETKTPLKVKLGLDPTRPDLHLGHTVVLRKLRAFQDLGHQAILIIGDATAMIGDPSGRSTTRPPLSEEEVEQNAQTYLAQAGKVIDVAKAQIICNSQWLRSMGLGDFLKLAARATAAQILAREDFATRLRENRPIALHELFYPLMQGYDSVMIEADIELGGSDQRFNNLMGRELQTAYGTKTEPQLVLLMPLLEGTDGHIKMSKSYPEHCINLTDLPNDMYGKLMSIPDALIPRYESLLGLLSDEAIAQQQQQFTTGALNPRDVKMQLAHAIVSLYHGKTESQAAEDAFVRQFQKKEMPEDMPEVTLSPQESHPVLTLMIDQGLAPTKNEARRLIAGGGVKLDGQKLSDAESSLCGSTGQSMVLQVGKRKFLRIVFTP